MTREDTTPVASVPPDETRPVPPDDTRAVSPVGFLDPDDAFTRRFVEQPIFETGLERIDVYDLPRVDLHSFPGLVVSSQVDQDFLYRHRGLIRSYLDDGAVVAFSGHLSRRWLPGAGRFEPKTIESHEDYTVVEARSHPVFEGVETEDLTYQRGVSGFFARGHNPPPDHATVLLRLADGEPVVYVDDDTTDGTIFAHSGNDLIAFGGRSTTAANVPEQLIEWIRTKSKLPSSASRTTTPTRAESVGSNGSNGSNGCSKEGDRP